MFDFEIFQAAESKETENNSVPPAASSEQCNLTVINNGPIIANSKVFQQKYSYMTNAAAPNDVKNNFNIYSNNLILNKGFTHLNSNNINSINSSFTTEAGQQQQQQQQQLYKASLNGVVYNSDNTNCINYSPIFISN